MPIEPNAYRRDWAAWLRTALPLLEREAYREALENFPRPVARPTPLQRPSGERRIALISTAGAFDPHTQAPFAAASAIGDITFRLLSTDLPDERIAFSHGHYDSGPAEADREVVLPRTSLQAAGGALTPHVISTMGYCLDWPSFIEQTIPQIVAQVRADGANCALLVPV